MSNDLKDCPVCNSIHTHRDTYPGSNLDQCDRCGSEWTRDCGEITLDARDYYTDEENKALGRNPL